MDFKAFDLEELTWHGDSRGLLFEKGNIKFGRSIKVAAGDGSQEDDPNHPVPGVSCGEFIGDAGGFFQEGGVGRGMGNCVMGFFFLYPCEGWNKSQILESILIFDEK